MGAKTPLDYAKWSCDTMMRIKAEELPPVGKHHYHQGVALMGMQKTYELCNDKKYFNYIKAWVDSVTNPDGSVISYHKEHLDDLMPCMLLFNLYKETKDERYKKTFEKMMPHFNEIQKNPLGGFWHKEIRPNQMWLDGLYMGGPLLSKYTKEFGFDNGFEIVKTQIDLMWDNMRKDDTGLLKHAWDYYKEFEWADPETGLSPEYWGRALGWYAVALMDIHENMPDEYRPDIESKEVALIDALLKYQRDDGMWSQVIDKKDDPANWAEVSCTSLFVYAICKAYNIGLVDATYFERAYKAYEGVISTLKVDEDGGLLIGGVCIGTGVGDYQFYLDRPTCVNDLHGIGAFLYMCTEVERAQNKYNSESK